jgi:hypothetical protein
LFAYRLAVALGKVNVDAMLRRITAKQFREWLAYAELEPFDETRADYRTADIVRAIYNVHRGRGQQPIALEDAVLRFGGSAKATANKRQSPAEQLNIMRLLSIVHNSAPDSKQD